MSLLRCLDHHWFNINSLQTLSLLLVNKFCHTTPKVCHCSVFSIPCVIRSPHICFSPDLCHLIWTHCPIPSRLQQTAWFQRFLRKEFLQFWSSASTASNAFFFYCLKVGCSCSGGCGKQYSKHWTSGITTNSICESVCSRMWRTKVCFQNHASYKILSYMYFKNVLWLFSFFWLEMSNF